MNGSTKKLITHGGTIGGSAVASLLLVLAMVQGKVDKSTAADAALAAQIAALAKQVALAEAEAAKQAAAADAALNLRVAVIEGNRFTAGDAVGLVTQFGGIRTELAVTEATMRAIRDELAFARETSKEVLDRIRRIEDRLPRE